MYGRHFENGCNFCHVRNVRWPYCQKIFLRVSTKCVEFHACIAKGTIFPHICWTNLQMSLPPSLSEGSNTSSKDLLPTSLLKVKKLKPFQKDDQLVKQCIVIIWRAWFVTHYMYLWKVPKAFSLKPSFTSTWKAVSATHQVKLSMLVKEAWCYNIRLLKSQKLQTHTQTKYKYQ